MPNGALVNRDSVKTGLDSLVEQDFGSLKGKNIGLLCNQASVDRDLNHISDLILESEGVNLKRFFAPEHGFRGVLQDMESVNSSVDKKSGIEIISLYGDSEESIVPTKEALKDLDALVFDLQDVGTRFYTFAQTLAYTMKVAAEAGTEVVVIDRPNPISGLEVEGPSVEQSCRSFCGYANTAVRHGLTMGELAQIFNQGFGEGPDEIEAANCDLTVVELSGWSRDMYFDETGLPWVLPSPNMPRLDTAIVYPGTCLFEATQLSEARGTTLPLEQIGAPYIDPEKWIDAIYNLIEEENGFVLRPTSFLPKYQKHAGKVCNGVQIHVVSRDYFDPFRLGLAMIYAAKQAYPHEFSWREGTYEFKDDIAAIDLLFGSGNFRKVVDGQGDFFEVLSEIEEFEELYASEREEYLLY